MKMEGSEGEAQNFQLIIAMAYNNSYNARWKNEPNAICFSFLCDPPPTHTEGKLKEIIISLWERGGEIKRQKV